MAIGLLHSECSYAGNGLSSEFDVSFPMAEESRLVVTYVDATGENGEMQEGVDYTVNKKSKFLEKRYDLLSSGQYMQIKLKKPLPEQWTLILRRESPICQPTQFRGIRFDPTEVAVDRLTLVCQELARSIEELSTFEKESQKGCECNGERTAALEVNFQEQHELFTRRFEEANVAISALDTKIGHMEKRFDTVGVMFENVDDGLARLLESVGELRGRTDSIGDKVDAKMPVAPADGLWLASGTDWIQPEPEEDVTDVRSPIPSYYLRTECWNSPDPDRIAAPTNVCIDVGGKLLSADVPPLPLDINVPVYWDAAGWASPASRAGKDFYIYAIRTSRAPEPAYILSNNATLPVGVDYNGDNTRKIGGFHCLCEDVGNIEGHSLSGMMAGQILPASVWDLRHRPLSGPEGMVYCSGTGRWYQIYLTNTEGLSTFGGAVACGNRGIDGDGYPLGSRYWFSEVLSRCGMRLLTETEFPIVSGGSNCLTAVQGGIDPVTTGGHVDSKGRRMISNLGLEDCCGAYYQWSVSTASHFKADAAMEDMWHWSVTNGHGVVNGSGNGMVMGGSWWDATNCGPAYMFLNVKIWNSQGHVGGRGCSESAAFI